MKNETPYSKVFIDVTPGGVATPGVVFRELWPEPSRLSKFPPALRPRDDADLIELNALTEGANEAPVLLPDRIIPSLEISPKPTRSAFCRPVLLQPSVNLASPLPNSDRGRDEALCRANSASAFAFAA